MGTGLLVRLLAGAGLLAALAIGIAWFGAHERGVGAARVQQKWDQAIDKARAHSAEQGVKWLTQFNDIGARYDRQVQQPQPSVAASTAAAVHAGAVRLRDIPTETCPRRMPAAARRSAGADEAARAAAQRRLEDSLAAVRVGDEADARIRQLSEQVIGLQNILRVERNAKPTATTQQPPRGAAAPAAAY